MPMIHHPVPSDWMIIPDGDEAEVPPGPVSTLGVPVPSTLATWQLSLFPVTSALTRLIT